jgi:hypothetical protein
MLLGMMQSGRQVLCRCHKAVIDEQVTASFQDHGLSLSHCNGRRPRGWTRRRGALWPGVPLF